MNNRAKTNIHLDGEITGASPDAQYDYYNTSDARRDFDYTMSKILDLFSARKGSAATAFILNSKGGSVTDSGAGQVDISICYAIGLATDGAIRPVYYPGAVNISLPSGWNDGRAIWVILKHEFLVTGATRNHAAFPSQSYHPQVIDSYYGNANSNLLFTDASPAAGTVILGKFTMTGTTFANLNIRSDEVSVMDIVVDNGTSWTYIHAEDGGGEWLSNAVESAGSYTRKYAESAFRIKHTGGATHAVKFDTAADGTAGSAITWVNAFTLDCTTGKITSLVTDSTIIAGGAISATQYLTLLNLAGEIKALFTQNDANTYAQLLTNAYDLAAPKLREAGYSTRHLFDNVSGAHVWSVSQNGAADDVITVETILAARKTIIDAYKAIVLNGDKYIGNLVVYDDTDVPDPSFTVSGLTSGTYFVWIQGQITNIGDGGTLIYIREGGIVGTIKAMLRMYVTPDVGSESLNGAAIAIITGTSFSITNALSAGSGTILNMYAYMRIA